MGDFKDDYLFSISFNHFPMIEMRFFIPMKWIIWVCLEYIVKTSIIEISKIKYSTLHCQYSDNSQRKSH